MEKRQASKFYPYFNIEERPTVDKLVGLFNNIVFKQEAILTDFLDPGQRDILKTIAGKEILVQEFGGYKAAEKKRVYLDPYFQKLDIQDFEIIPIEIDYPQKFVSLNHSNILGTLANSGVDLDTIGDIITDDEANWQFFVKKDLADFFINQIDRIGRTKVKLKPVNLKQVLSPVDDSKVDTSFVVSLRLDAVISAITNKSRSQAKELIESGLVKLNWHKVENSNIIIKENDMLSVRHFGRIQITDFTATRKARFKVVFKLWQKHTKKIR